MAIKGKKLEIALKLPVKRQIYFIAAEGQLLKITQGENMQISMQYKINKCPQIKTKRRNGEGWELSTV